MARAPATRPLTPTHYVLVSAIVVIGAVLQGSIGFGLGVFAVPLLLLFAPQTVPGPLLASSVVLTMLLTHRERRDVRWRDLGWAIVGRVFGIALAVLVLAVVSADRLGLLSGLFVLVAVGITATGLRLPTRPGVLAVAGLLSGFLGTAVSIGGPPMALLYQHETGPSIRGTLSAFFVVGVTMSLIGLAMVGRFGLAEMRLAALLIPAVLVGYAVSRRLARILDRGYLRPAILIMSALTSAIVIARQVF